jgi:hypothetical protein
VNVALPAFVAHQGGWDEVLIFGLPVVAVLLGVRLVEKRARSGRGEKSSEDGDGTSIPGRDRPQGES